VVEEEAAVAAVAAATDRVVAVAATDGVAVAAAVTAGAGAVGIIQLTFPVSMPLILRAVPFRAMPFRVMVRRTLRIGVAAAIIRM
jgi:hypothetical protein